MFDRDRIRAGDFDAVVAMVMLHSASNLDALVNIRILRTPASPVAVRSNS
jgi:hypothetical protein